MTIGTGISIAAIWAAAAWLVRKNGDSDVIGAAVVSTIIIVILCH